MQNSVAPVAAVCRAASTSDGMSSRAARTGVSKRPDWEQKWQSSGQPPVLSETIPSTSTSGPHQRIRTSWASCSSVVERARRAAAAPRAPAPRRRPSPARGPARGRCRGSRLSSSRLGSLPCATQWTGQSVRAGLANAAGSRPPAPAGRRRAAARPSTAGRSTRLQRAARSGSAGQAPMTTPAQVSPRRRSSSTVSSVWLSVPSPAAATTSTGAPSIAATSASVPPSSSKRTSRPPAPSTSTRSWSAASSSAAVTTASGGRAGRPARRAAVAGASGSG